MSTLHTKTFLSGFLVAFFVLGATSVQAAPLGGKVDAALDKKDLTQVQGFLATGPGNVDEVIKALLKRTQKVLTVDPDFSAKMLALAGQYAPQITPPTVPAVCADLRRIVDAVPADQVQSPLFTTVVETSEKFSKAPVVVAAGRPNQCEQAFLQIATLAGEDPLLAQLPGMRGPGLPPQTIRPGIPPNEPPPTEKPSAD